MQLEDIIAKELAGIINEKFSAWVDQVKAMEMRLNAVEAREPEKGATGEKGDKGDRGDIGFRGETGIPGPTGTSGPIGPQGVQGPVGPQGDPGPIGPQGEKGLPGQDGAGPSRGRHRGPWKANEQYQIDDSVTSGGSGWIAIVDDPKGRPGSTKDWQLFVMKGRDGKDGRDGDRGPQGPAGKDYA